MKFIKEKGKWVTKPTKEDNVDEEIDKIIKNHVSIDDKLLRVDYGFIRAKIKRLFDK